MERCNSTKVPARDGAVKETRPDQTDCDARLRGLGLILEAAQKWWNYQTKNVYFPKLNPAVGWRKSGRL